MLIDDSDSKRNKNCTVLDTAIYQEGVTGDAQLAQASIVGMVRCRLVVLLAHSVYAEG